MRNHASYRQHHRSDNGDHSTDDGRCSIDPAGVCIILIMNKVIDARTGNHDTDDEADDFDNHIKNLLSNLFKIFVDDTVSVKAVSDDISSSAAEPS